MPGRSRCSAILAGVQRDLHRHALHHLDEVAAGVLGREQAEAGPGGRGDAVDVPVEGVVVGVDHDAHVLPGPHLLELCLLEIRRHPDVVERHDGEQWLADLDDLAGLHGAAADEPAARSLHFRVFEIQPGLFERGLRALYPRFGSGGMRLARGDLRRSGRRCGRRRLRSAQPGLRLCDLALRPGGVVLRFGDRGTRRGDRRLRGFGGGDGCVGLGA